MLFIDGTWLYASSLKLAEVSGRPNFRIDYRKLPDLLASRVARQRESLEIDVVRTYLFGSYAADYDPRDEEAVQRRRDFFALLSEEYRYEVLTFPVNFGGRRLRRADRDPEDPFEPKEKCVDIALASTMLYFTAIPGAYDIAIAVIGDLDFKPALQYARQLGKRVAIASIKESCAAELADPRDEARVKDFDIVWIDDLLDELELRFEPHELECESPTHRGNRRMVTTYYPRKGERFYCDDCRAEFASQRLEAQRLGLPEPAGPATLLGEPPTPRGKTLRGEVARKIADKGYGFIRATDGQHYFFHVTDLRMGLEFEGIQVGDQMQFTVKRLPGQDRAGAAQDVRPLDEVEAELV